MKNLVLLLVLLATAFVMPGCNGEKTEQTTETTEGESAAKTDSTQQLAYVCPMRCEGSGSTEPGKCKMCDMDLIKNPDHKAAHADSVQQGTL